MLDLHSAVLDHVTEYAGGGVAASVCWQWCDSARRRGVRRRFVVLLSRPPPPCSCSVHLDALATDHRVDLLARCVSSALFLSNGTRRDTEILLVFAAAGGGASGHHCDGVWVVRLHGDRVRHLHPAEKSIASILVRAMFPRQCAAERRLATVAKRSPHAGVAPMLKTKTVSVRTCYPLHWQLERLCARYQREDGAASVGQDGCNAGGDGRCGGDGGAAEAEAGVGQGTAQPCCKGVSCTLEPSLEHVLRSCGQNVYRMELDATQSVSEVLRRARVGHGAMTTFVLGDDTGFTESAVATLGSCPSVECCTLGNGQMLLTSHCIVLLHYALDML